MALTVEAYAKVGFSTAGVGTILGNDSSFSGAGAPPVAGDFIVVAGFCAPIPAFGGTYADVPTMPGTEIGRGKGGYSYAVSVYGPLTTETTLDDLTLTAAGSSNWTIYGGALIRGATGLALSGSVGLGAIQSVAIGTTPGTQYNSYAPGAGDLVLAFSAGARESGSANWSLDTITPAEYTFGTTLVDNPYTVGLHSAPDPTGSVPNYNHNVYRTAGLATVSVQGIILTVSNVAAPNVDPDFFSNYERSYAKAKALPFYLDSGWLKGL